MQNKPVTDETAPTAPRSLIERVEETVRSALGIANTRHRSAMRDLRLAPDQDLVELIFRTVADNYVRGNAAANRHRSQEN